MNDQNPWRQWQLEGNIPEAYEKYLVPILFVPWAAKLIEFSKLEPDDRVLDVACGTGIVARLAARRNGAAATIIGLDLNPGMLAVANSASSDTDHKIEWREGSATDLPYEDETFEVVFCQFSLSYFPDRMLALREMLRVLTPGGRLLLNLPRPIQYWPSTAILADALGRHMGSESVAMMNAPFALSNAEDLRSLIAGAGFQDVGIRIVVETFRSPSPEEFVWRQIVGSPLAGPFAKISDEAKSALIKEVSVALQSYIDDDGLVHPMEAYFAIAHRKATMPS